VVDGGPQVFPGHRDIVPRPAAIKLAAIDKLEIRIEQENVRSAGGFVGLGHGLRFVIEIREDKAISLRLLL